MTAYRVPITIMLVLAMFTTLLLPMTPAMAASPLDLLSQTMSTSSSGSSFNLLNTILGLLLGNLLGKTNPTSNSNVSIKSLPSTSDTSSKGSDLINTAKSYMGVPYVWGGETPDGFDCSGFTQYVMKQNGITLPRTAADQYAQGTAVDKQNLQMGDLIFFTTYKPGASHVGFYIGNGQFIHASSAAKQVTISSLDEAFYTQHYIGARRYI